MILYINGKFAVFRVRIIDRRRDIFLFDSYVFIVCGGKAHDDGDGELNEYTLHYINYYVKCVLLLFW